jgi:hypothetical protein
MSLAGRSNSNIGEVGEYEKDLLSAVNLDDFWL